MEKIRILITTSEDYFGSIARDIATTIRLIDHDRFETAVACPKSKAIERFAEAGAATYRVEMPTKYDPRPVLKLSGIIRQWRPQIVHAHTARAALFSALASRGTSSTVIQTEHNWTVDVALADTNERPRVLTRLLHRVLARGMIARVIVYSSSSADFHLKMNKLDPQRLRLIMYCVDPPPPVNPQVVAAKRAELGIAKEALVVSNFGRHDPVKGLTYLVDAMPEVLRARPNTVFCFFGDGAQRQRLETRVKELGIDRSVVFGGWRHDVYDMMALTDVVAVASLSESAGRIVMEAMAAGRPLVATEVAALPEYIGGESVGLMVPPKDSGAMATALTKLLGDDALRRKMGEAARERYESTFRPERFVRDLQSIYDEVIRETDPR